MDARQGDRTDGGDDKVLMMIGAAVMAGAYSSLAKEVPEARTGLEKMAAKHSQRVKALAAEICAEAARVKTDAASDALPNRKR